MTEKPQDKLTDTSLKIILEYLNLENLNGVKNKRTNRALAVKKTSNRLSPARDPLAETLIRALKSPDTKTEKEITQIIHAQGWMAVFASEPELFNRDMIPLPKYYTKPLICWALKRQFDETQQKYDKVVVGIVDYKQGTFECSLLSNFLSYRKQGYEKEDNSLREAWFNWYDSGN